jgi:hypothetical protein
MNGEHNMDQGHHNHGQGSFFASAANIALLGFLVIGGYFLVTEHRAHIATAIPYLPVLLLLACPLMHIFMHGGHGGHGEHDGGGSSRGSSPDDGQSTPPHQH